MPRSLSLRLLLILCLPLLFALPLAAEDWEPVDPAMLSLSTPKLDPQADAEFLLRRLKIEDRVYGARQVVLVLTHYVRLKIYTERGKEKYSTIDLRTSGDGIISDLKARAILPDGRTIVLQKDEIFERDVKRASGNTVRQKSFAFPGLEVGAVVEYQFRTTHDNRWSDHLPLDVQHEEPAWRVEFQVKPIDFSQTRFVEDLYMRTRPFQCKHEGWQQVGHGWYGTSFTDVPAFREEIYMPPEEYLKSWLLIYYDERIPPPPDKYWAKYSKKEYDEEKRYSKVDGKVEALAAKLTEGAQSPDEKVLRLVNYCRKEVKNIYHPLFGISSADIGEWKPILKPSETLERGMGTGRDIERLLVALATAAGFDARFAHSVGRNEFIFEKEFGNDYFVKHQNVAIKVGADWKFFDVTQPLLEPGMLPWPEEGVVALIADSKKPEFVNSPMSEPERSNQKRIGRFRLEEDGTLEGDAVMIETGFFGLSEKLSYVRKTEAERIQAFEDELKERFPAATISEVRVENVNDVDKPVTFRYHIRMPGYAERTGKRLFLVPSFFQRGVPTRFTASERLYPIYFPFAWSGLDDIEIELPPGYELDAADAPMPMSMAPAGDYSAKLQIRREGEKRTLICQRNFHFGNGGRLMFPLEAYPALKQIFEAIHASDNHVITLKAATTGGE